MEENMTPSRIANAIMQDLTFTGYYIIVEGNKDEKLYGKFIFNTQIRIKPAFGNEKVKEVLRILDERGFDKRIGIIDADFRNILNKTENIEGLFITDEHDIEVMMIKTKALENVINIFCKKKDIQDFEKKNAMSIRDKIYSLAREIGYLKLANKIYNLGLVFKPKTVDGNQIKYANFTCDKTLDFLGKDKLIETSINYSRNRSEQIENRQTIEKKYAKIAEKKYDLLQLINGHDLSNFLYILMKKVLKSKNKMLANFNSIEDSLILSYEHNFFKKTVIYDEIKIWSKMHKIQMFE